MYLAIENGARCIGMSGRLGIRLIDTIKPEGTRNSQGARLEVRSSDREQDKERVWVFKGPWFARKSYDEHLEVFDYDGRSRIVVLKTESHRALLRVAVKRNGRWRKRTKTFWLIKRPEEN